MRVCIYKQGSLSYSFWLVCTSLWNFPWGNGLPSHWLLSKLKVFAGPTQSPFQFRCVSPLTCMGWDEMFDIEVKTIPSALLGWFPCISIGESTYHGKRWNYLKGLYCRAVALWKPWQGNWIWLVCKAARAWWEQEKSIKEERGNGEGEPFTFLQRNIPSSDCLGFFFHLCCLLKKIRQNKTKLCNCSNFFMHQASYLTSGPHNPRANLTLSVVFIVLVCFLPVQRKGQPPEQEVRPWSGVCKSSESHFTKSLQSTFKHAVITQGKLLILAITTSVVRNVRK